MGLVLKDHHEWLDKGITWMITWLSALGQLSAVALAFHLSWVALEWQEDRSTRLRWR